MKLEVIALGRLRASPERALIDDYLDRAEKSGRGIGLAPVSERELEPRGASDPDIESQALAEAAAGAERVCLLDERGKALSSREFAAMLARWRDEGAGGAAFLIGGADGVRQDALPRVDAAVSFGRLTWPHKLARVMLAEQLYRGVTILTGSPYHRD